MAAPRLRIPLAQPEQNASMDMNMILMDVDKKVPPWSLRRIRIDLSIRLVALVGLMGFVYVWGYTTLSTELGLPRQLGTVVFLLGGLLGAGPNFYVARHTAMRPGWQAFLIVALGLVLVNTFLPAMAVLNAVVWLIPFAFLGYMIWAALDLFIHIKDAQRVIQFYLYLRTLPRKERKATMARMRQNSAAASGT